jgi:hypothetical protein
MALLAFFLCAAAVQAQATPTAGDAPDTAPTASAEHQQKPWEVTLSPYLWLAGADVHLGSYSANVSASDILRFLDAGFMVNASAQYRDFGLVADYVFVNLGATNQVGGGSAHLDFKLDTLDMRGSYRVVNLRRSPEPDSQALRVMVDMGARFWSIDPTLTVKLDPLLPNGMGTEDVYHGKTSWWDGIVGAHMQADVAKRVSFALGGNLGGFGIGSSSSFTWELTGAAVFQIWEVLHVDVAYRALQFRRSGTETLPVAKLTMAGPALGLTAAF